MGGEPHCLTVVGARRSAAVGPLSAGASILLEPAGPWEVPLPVGSLRVPLLTAAVSQLAKGWRDFLLTGRL